MNEINELFWAVIGPILSFLIGLFIDILLPDRYRVKFQLIKRKMSKWIYNHSYIVGISSRVDLKQNEELEKFKADLKDIFFSENPTIRGLEIHFKNSMYSISIMLI